MTPFFLIKTQIILVFNVNVLQVCTTGTSTASIIIIGTDRKSNYC
jgi:hypothetical protein